MTEPNRSSQFRPVNQSLGQQPSLGPIPANLLAPSGGILIGSYFLIQVVLSLGFVWFLLVSTWGVCTWWVVVGEKTWKFTNKFISTPDWNRGYVRYTPCLQNNDDDSKPKPKSETVDFIEDEHDHSEPHRHSALPP